MTEVEKTNLERKHPEARIIDSDHPDIAYIVDDDRKGIIISVGDQNFGLRRDQVRTLAKELPEVLRMHLGVCV